jgi:hypothetical protein
MLPTGNGSDVTAGCALPTSKKMIMGADTLLCCKAFVLSARLG